MAAKTNPGNFFEDFTTGKKLVHAVPRTLTEGECALYVGLYGDRFPLHSSAEYARSLGLEIAIELEPFKMSLVNGVDNNTNPWGNIGQVSGCQTNLEVGDPLSGKLQSTRLGGKTWHPQELAFFSWFYHQRPSIGVNRWYSSNGTFTSAAAPCP